MSDAKFKTYVVTNGENGDVFGNAKTMSDLRIYMYEFDKKDDRIKELEVEIEELRKRLNNSKEYACDCLDRTYENHSCQKELETKDKE